MHFKIDSWYDKQSRNYITQIVDENNNQIGDAYYDGNKESRKCSLQMARDEIQKLIKKESEEI